MNIPADFSLNAEDFQLRNFFEKLLSRVTAFARFTIPSEPFVRTLANAMRILGCTCGTKYSLLDLAKK